MGPGGYQLGRFGPAFAEWNDRFRDTARRFWRGDAGLRGEIATRIAGSRDVFAHAAAPSKGVNFVVAHDGFTLRDLVSYAHKHNEANGEDNRDGTDNNLSWNHGVEGPTDDPAIIGGALARRAQPPDAALGLARRADAGDGHRSSASARAATTTPTPRTTRRARSTGAPPTLRSSPSPPGSSRRGGPIPRCRATPS